MFFRRREAEVYPDDYPNKPEVGQELNKPSEITIFKVWPNDKSTHTPVKVIFFFYYFNFILNRISKNQDLENLDFLKYFLKYFLGDSPFFCIEQKSNKALMFYL